MEFWIKNNLSKTKVQFGKLAVMAGVITSACFCFLFVSCILQIQKVKKGKIKMKKIIQDGITYYVADDVCVDIDIDDSIDTVIFQTCNDQILDFSLRNVKKVFPNVTVLSVQFGVCDIRISNYMFPNAREVYSANPNYLSGKALKYCNSMGEVALLNAFCLNEDESIDIAYANEIYDFALEGCKTRNLNARATKIKKYHPQSFIGSAFHTRPEDNGICMFGNVVIDVDYSMDNIILPRRAKIDNNLIDVMKIKKLTFLSAQDIIYQPKDCVFPKYIYVIDNISNSRTLSIAAGKSGIASFEVKDNPYVVTQDGVLFSKDKTELIKCPLLKSGAYVIPDSIKTIHEFAFFNTQITSLTFSNATNVQMEKYCFHHCEQLKYVDFGNKLKNIGPGVNIFSRCLSLEEIHIPKQIKNISDCSFSFCKNLKKITFDADSQLQQIDNSAFYGDPVNTICLPKSLRRIGQRNFTDANEIHAEKLNNNIAWIVLSSIFQYSASNEELTDFDYCKVWMPNRECPVIVPKALEYSGKTHNMIANIKYGIFDNTILNKMYRYGYSPLLRAELGFITYLQTHDESAKKYVRSLSKQLAVHLIKNNQIEWLKQLLDNDMLSKSAIQAASDAAADMNNTIAQVYLLESQKGKTKSVFSL